MGSRALVLVGVIPLLLAGCSGDDQCPGGAVRDPGRPKSLERSAPLVRRWGKGLNGNAGLLERNTNVYRFDGNVAVVGEQGVTVRLADYFAVEGCASPGAQQGVDDLMKARFGATFLVDPDSGEVVRAGCNGCE